MYQPTRKSLTNVTVQQTARLLRIPQNSSFFFSFLCTVFLLETSSFCLFFSRCWHTHGTAPITLTHLLTHALTHSSSSSSLYFFRQLPPLSASQSVSFSVSVSAQPVAPLHLASPHQDSSLRLRIAREAQPAPCSCLHLRVTAPRRRRHHYIACHDCASAAPRYVHVQNTRRIEAPSLQVNRTGKLLS